MPILRGAILPIFILLLWDAFVRFHIWPSTIIAGPGNSVVALGRLLWSGELFRHALSSVGRLCGGVAIGVSLGGCLAVVAGMSRITLDFVGPTIRFLSPIPAIAWIPVLIVAFGIDGAKIAIIAVGAGVLVYSATLSAIQDTPEELVEVARCYEMRPMTVMFRVVLPYAAWDILAGFRIAVALSWVLLLASELIASSSGLGWLIWDARNFARPDEMIAGMLFVGILGYFSDWVIGAIQIYLNGWRKSFEGV